MPNTYLRLILIIEYGTLAFGQHGHLFREINACYKEHRQLLTRVEALERSTVQLQNEIQLKSKKLINELDIETASSFDK